MGLLDHLDPEEQVGRAWHRLVGQRGSYPDYPDAAVRLDELRGALGVFYRGLGGAAGREISAGTARSAGHRLRWRERLTQGEERLPRALRSPEALCLPPRLALFPDRALNRRLYFWLAAWFAALPEDAPTPPADPLRADLLALRRARAASAAAVGFGAGLAETHVVLARGVLASRPVRRLPPVEAAVEALVRQALGTQGALPPLAEELAGALSDDRRLAGLAAPRGYRPFLPVPIWGELAPPAAGAATRPDAAGTEARPETEQDPREDDGRRRPARRQRHDNVDRKDPLILFNKPDFFLSFTEMLNLNRAVEDSDPGEARHVADELDHLSLNDTERKAASTLKLGLDLQPAEAATAPLVAEVTYPEWDWKRGVYLPDHCALREEDAPITGEAWVPDESARQHIRRVRRQFEALRGRRELLRAQPDGSELDTDALVRSRCDLAARGEGDDRIHVQVRDTRRDLAVAILVDASRSTDGWVQNRRVMDVQKEALSAFALGLQACGDRAAIHAFASRRRRDVRLQRIKGFDARVDATTLRRIAALKPGDYTRIGTALRHTTALLRDRPERHRLILLLTDGKPNDLDHYEGRHGLEDTRQAVREARRAGCRVFAVTVDRRAEDYVPYLFGRGGYAVINRIERLAPALPAIYRQLVT